MQGAKKQRSCVVCRKKTDKQALYRLVRDGEGHVSIDQSGKVAGRGAYVCSEECLREALATKRCDRALRTKIATQDNDRLIAEFKAISVKI